MENNTLIPNNKKTTIEGKNVIFFDGVCNLCNGFIDYVIKRDKQKAIFYISLQSSIAIEFLALNDITINSNYSTIYFYTNRKFYSKSTAILKILGKLSRLNRVFSQLLLVLPKSVRNTGYDFIAKNRYYFFGKKDSCRMPTLEEKNQFI